MHVRAREAGERQPGHLSFAGWGLVVPPQEMEETMDCKESRFHLRLVPERLRLTPDCGPRQGQIAKIGARRISAQQVPTRKAEDVGHPVVAQKLAVQPPQLAIARDSHRDLSRTARSRQHGRNRRLGGCGHEHPTHEGRCDGRPDSLHHHHAKADN